MGKSNDTGISTAGLDASDCAMLDVPDAPRHQGISSDAPKSCSFFKETLLRSKGKEKRCSRHVKYHPQRPETNIRYRLIDPENTYEIASFPRGVAVIFNMYEFEASTGLQDFPRTGTEKDANDTTDLFLKLGFIVHRYDDVTKDELLNALREIQKVESKLDCFACVILSHGEEGQFYTRDKLVNLGDTFSILESPLWVGKPKLFFIQACQGGKYMDEVEPDGLDEVDAPVYLPNQLIPLPRQSDFLYAYSTAAGYSSWRNSENGSWFIQEICEAFRKYAHEFDLLRIMTRANKKISVRVTNTDSVETNNKRQIASIVSQLTKDLHLFPPYGPIARIAEDSTSYDTYV